MIGALYKRVIYKMRTEEAMHEEPADIVKDVNDHLLNVKIILFVFAMRDKHFVSDG
jgi:hypothetical protein